MAKLLYIYANPKPEGESLSLTVGRQFITEYRKSHPEDIVTEIDVYNYDIPHIDKDVFSGWGKLSTGSAFDSLDIEEKRKVSRINELTEEFISGDKYVFVTPFWNFSFPPMMKAYIDTICIAGRTFKYTENGPVGLLQGKKVLHIQASGGVYSEGPASGYELGHRYIKTICNFLGITDVAPLFIEGAAAAPDKTEEIKNKAIESAKKQAKEF